MDSNLYELPSLRDLHRRIDMTMQADRHRFGNRLRGVEQARRSGRPFDRNLRRLVEEIDRSVATCQQRQQSLPHVIFDESLPISAHRHEITEAIRQHQVVLVCGETGSGKSTQLPKICLAMGRGVSGWIGHTQPRRIAARSVASRIAEELGSPLGKDVSFKVRFTDTTSPQTYVKLMTDGILLAESQNDRFFNAYDTIIIDEAHERSLNIDFLLGFLKRLLPGRPDLRLIITSATINAEHFSQHFASPLGPAPIIEVSGRTYPVEVRYRLPEPIEGEAEPDLETSILQAVDELAEIDRGDMLIFMPTERDILATAKALRGHAIPGDTPGRKTEVVPLYARLSTAEQNRVFQPHSNRRIVIATNVAESSLTVPGIRYVIDPGLARVSRYSPRSKVQRLPIEPVSRASADQRKGRCGRVGPGVCIRLYSEEDYVSRDAFTLPEIQRSNLASVILQIKALRFGEIDNFPFLDPPRPEAIRDGYRTLFEIGAVDAEHALTDLGRKISQIPTDPRIARIILAADAENCLHEILIIASALELQDPRERPSDKKGSADEAHAKFVDERSDFLSYLKLWDFFHEQKQKLSQNQLRKACKQNFLSFNRMREWLDIHRQLTQVVKTAGLVQQSRRDDSAAIHKALLAGFLSGVALRAESNEYTAAGGAKAHLWPGSALFSTRPKWVLAAESVETARRYLRTVGRIDPNWIESLATHLVNRSFSEVHWDRQAASAMAFEKVSLFGLPIVPRRRTRYGRIDATRSRELFIQHALVEGDYDTRAPFFLHNKTVLDAVEKLESKTRRRDLLLGEEARIAFYNARIPEKVFDGRSFDQWRRQAERANPRLLFMSEADLVRVDAAPLAPEEFPDRIVTGRAELPLDYHFEPGSAQDGVTVVVPQEALGQVDPQRLGWLVPGLVEEKIVALIKSLPKPVRRHFVPAPDTAKRVLSALQYGRGEFNRAVADTLSALSGERISVDLFGQTEIPTHLRMNVKVVDAEGAPVAMSRNFDELRQQVVQEVTAAGSFVDDSRWTRDGITTWDFDELPREMLVSRSGVTFPLYPSIVDRQESVSLRLLSSPESADWETRAGIRRLFLLTTRRQVKSQVDWLPDLSKMLLYASGLNDPQPFKTRIGELIADRAFFISDALPRSQPDFETHAEAGRQRLGLAAGEIAPVLPKIMEAYHIARLALEKANNSQYSYAIGDMREQIDHLMATQSTMPAGTADLASSQSFLTATPWPWLVHYPRYLQAIVARLDRLGSGGQARDRQNFAALEPLWQAYLQRAAEHRERGIIDPELTRFRWMLEEFRVSLFAQRLGTACPVSEKRLDEQWRKVQG